MKSLFKSKTALFFLSLSISLTVLLGFSLYYNFTVERPIRVVDLNMLTQEQAMAWATENDIKLEILEAYDENVTVGTVLNQGTNVGERIFAGSTISITLSKGPDPDVLVDLIDFTGKDIGDVQTFIDSSKLMNATIKFEKNDDIASAFFIRQSIASGQIKRSDKIDFFISTGDKDTLTTVTVPDFSTYTRQQVSSWGSTSNIKINFVEEFNKDFEQGKIFEQSKAPNESIYDGSSLTVKLSLGTGVVLENFVGKSKSAIDSFIKENGLQVTYDYTYSSQQNKDYGISMLPGASVRVASNSTVKVTLSLGKVSVSDFTGKTVKEFETWLTEVNKQGAGLKFSSSVIYSDTVSANKIIKQTPSSGDINPGTSITLSVSKGLGITVKDFEKKTDTQDGLVIKFIEQYSSLPKDSVISQSIPVGNVVDNGTTITLTISLGQVPLSSFVGNTLNSFKDWINTMNSKGAKLTYTSSEAYNGTIVKGSLISQSPSSGSVNPGLALTIQVSKGAGITVINFVGTSTTSQSGLTVSKSEVYSDTIANGIVISQSIPSGTVVDSGTSISLVVSKGAEPTMVLPDLAGIIGTSTGVDTTKSQLTNYFNSTGLTNYNFVTGAYGIGAGQINDQSPAGGTTIKFNTSITVYISTN